jgi:translation initiation factor 3 subunit G
VQELFRPFGFISRVYVSTDTYADGTQVCKGFAFVSFYQKDCAEKAIKKLNGVCGVCVKGIQNLTLLFHVGYGYDHLILRVDWSKPSEKDRN